MAKKTFSEIASAITQVVKKPLNQEEVTKVNEILEKPVVVKTEPKIAIDLFKGSDNIYYRVELKYDVDTMEATVVSIKKLDDTFPRAALKFEKEMYTKVRSEKYKKQETK